ncbi:hypothetical protein OIE66_24095 [Nonomuraea sp. NBC_01738]|uniref:hypothetical protein n=1 Tax=Nonomuraea sp. NBC_01738 TaxID=2976003 RepID=UPI002E0D5456|nr:hypothetical protein OIE66_24095 [Nonomuraea sp. NBC_01738]
MNASTARDIIAASLGDSVQVRVKEFPTGDLAIKITSGAHTVAVDGNDTGGWSYTIEGRKENAADLDTVLRAVRETIG